jgi:hypothetical protein
MNKDCDCEKTIIHGDHDKYGCGVISGNIGCLLILIVLALACTGNLSTVLIAIFG